MKKNLVILSFCLFVLSVFECAAGEDLQIPALTVETPEEAAVQTRIYENMSDHKFHKLCREFLIEKGYTMSFIDRDIGLVRAWKDGEGEAGVKRGVFTFTVDCYIRETVVIFLTPMDNDLKVRVQFTVRNYEPAYSLPESEEARPDFALYSTFFRQLNSFIHSAG